MADDNPYLTRHELLAQELDKFEGLTPQAIKDLADLFGPRCIQTDTGITLDGKNLADAAKDIVEARPYLRTASALSPEQLELQSLREEAVGGSLTAFAKLRKMEGNLKADPKGLAKELEAWRASHKVKSPNDEAGDEARKNNPWSAAGWSVTAQGKLVRAIGIGKAAQIAKAAGSFIGATKPGGAA